MNLTSSLERALQVNAAGIATVDHGKSRTWREFVARVERLAAAFLNSGIEPGGRVAMLAKNGSRYLEYYYATFWAGGVAVPLNTRWAVPEITFALTDSGARILILDDHFAALAPDLLAAAPDVRTLIFCGDGSAPDGALHWESLIAATEPVRDAVRGWNDTAGIFYTGGTTGRSKGVMLSHGNLVTNGMAEAIWLNMRQRSSYLHAAPSFHLADAAAGFAMTAVAGTHVFVEAFDPAEVLRAIADSGATHLLLVPTMIQMLIEHPGFAPGKAASVETIFYGGSPMAEALLERALAALPRVRFVQAYGMTETSAIATILEPDFHVTSGPNAGRLRSAGRPASHVALNIVDAEDRPLPPGEVGEIVVRGPNITAGYWNQPELSASTLRNGWMHTGDVGYLAEDGFLYVVDRLKDMIISGGENVYSAEVENAIAQHPAVRLCAVIGIPDQRWGEAVHAVVWPVADAHVTGDDIIAHCRRHIAGYKCPRSVDVTDREVPMSAAGKILKTTLREPYWRSHDKHIH